ncbi:Hpt domain-containing protein [Candidatus Parcubacteria bacterium]|jgi:HPt (histidine-containing phosphotransfer) domain-containing protein|nr:Hpt domain-containing protein [Candidatus Parcubacteria bacterium]
MNDQFAIRNILPGRLNALVKNIMSQTGESDPGEAVRLVNSGKWTLVKVLEDMNLGDTPVIDESRLIAEFGDDQEILAELRDLFLDHAPLLFDSIAQAIVARNTAIIVRDSHALRGACLTYGAPRLAIACKALESAAKNGDQNDINAAKDNFALEYKKALEAINNISAS